MDEAAKQPVRQFVLGVDLDGVVADYPKHVRDHPYASITEIPHLEKGLRGLEETRRIDLEMWMDELCLDAVVFPTVADVGPADMDVNEASADLGWRNGHSQIAAWHASFAQRQSVKATEVVED